jgi:hypothetical protein
MHHSSESAKAIANGQSPLRKKVRKYRYRTTIYSIILAYVDSLGTPVSDTEKRLLAVARSRFSVSDTGTISMFKVFFDCAEF